MLALMEEDDVSLTGVVLAAGLLAIGRVLQQDHASYPPTETLHLRASIEANLRQYCGASVKMGALSTHYEADFSVPPIEDRAEFWRYAHELTVKHNAAKGASREPLKVLRVQSKIGTEGFKEFEKSKAIRNEMSVGVYGDLGSLFRRETSSMIALASLEANSWNKPLSVTQRNIRLEDVFHLQSGQNMGSPVRHSAHILHGRLNYFLTYYSTYVDQRVALLVRDETVNILRMASDPRQ